MKILDCEQGSPEWVEARLGVITASRIGELFCSAPVTDLEAHGACGAPLKDGRACSQAALSVGGACKRHGGERAGPPAKKIVPSEARASLLNQLAGEWLLKTSLDPFTGNYWTERGKELEPHARTRFSFESGIDCNEVGFVYGDESGLIGCSPDWLNPGSGGGEIKCPKASTHIGFLLGDPVCPSEYVAQVQASIWICREPHWWFVSYYPDLPLFSVRCEPDPAWQSAFDAHLPAIAAELVDLRERLAQVAA